MLYDLCVGFCVGGVGGVDATYWLDWLEFILGFFKYHSGGLVNVGPVPHDDANFRIEVPLAFTPVPV